MSFLPQIENRIRCGRCGTEFDFKKNPNGCPLCGFGKNSTIITTPMQMTTTAPAARNYLAVPPELKLSKGTVQRDGETETMGLWGMFNDFFSGKAILRITSNLIVEQKQEYISLHDTIETAKVVFTNNNLLSFKGFPSQIEKESSVGRLVYHFLVGYYKMGLLEVKIEGNREKNDLWLENWKKILIRPTLQGLEFARVRNAIFDDSNKNEQVLMPEEKTWLVRYLKKIDSEGFKEYTTLNEVVAFLKKGHNGNEDLWGWFKTNPKFIAYLQKWSSKKNDAKAFEKQLDNLAKTFSASKVSLLRELQVIPNKRNEYQVTGDL